MATYYVRRNGKEFGPLTVEDLVAVANKRGGFEPGELIRADWQTTWSRADEFAWMPIKRRVPVAEIVTNDPKDYSRITIIAAGIAFAVGLVGVISFSVVRSLGEPATPTKMANVAPVKQQPKADAPPLPQPKIVEVPAKPALNIRADDIDHLLRNSGLIDHTTERNNSRTYWIDKASFVMVFTDGDRVSEIVFAFLTYDQAYFDLLHSVRRRLMPGWSDEDAGEWMLYAIKAVNKTKTSDPSDGMVVSIYRTEIQGQPLVSIDFLPEPKK